MEVRDLPMAKIVPGRKLRADDRDIEALAESIRENGLLQPIRVRPRKGGMYQIVAGHRRYEAHRLLRRRTIAAVVADQSDKTSAIEAIVENLQREDLQPLELAQGIRELVTAFNLGIDDIARAISKSRAQVAAWIRLSRLPDDVLARLESGEADTHAVEFLAPRHLQPFVSDLPSEEEAASDPELAARRDDVVERTREFVDAASEAPVRLTAHMSDEVARRAKSGVMTVREAVEEVASHPERYRYGRAYESADEMEGDTWDAYRKIHHEMRKLAHRLRPEIAVSFSPHQKRDLLLSFEGLIEMLEPYREALASAPPTLGGGDARTT